MSPQTFYDFQPNDKNKKPFPLALLRGKVVLVVNTASRCSFTPQLDKLEKLYQRMEAKYPSKFQILAFFCNQFGSQDPGSNEEIQTFCRVNHVTFPVLAKVEVNGPNTALLWTWMKEQQPGIFGLRRIKWNFEKFLISTATVGIKGDPQTLNQLSSSGRSAQRKRMRKALESLDAVASDVHARERDQSTSGGPDDSAHQQGGER